MAGNSADAGRSVTSKVIAILMTFTKGQSYSLTEIARLTGLPVSTTHRLATELAAWGVLERTDDTQYRVGLPLKVIGSQAPTTPGMQEQARRVMEDLVAATRANVRLGRLDDLDVSYLEMTPGGPTSLAFSATTMPAHATAMGKALLAFSPARTVDRAVARGLTGYTPLTVTNPERLRRALAVIRLTRIAVSRREFDAETSAIAAPVFGPGGGVAAALEVESCDHNGGLRLVQPALIVAARSLSRELVTSPPANQPGHGPRRLVPVGGRQDARTTEYAIRAVVNG